MTPPDPYGTGRIRESVLQAWTDSPERLREDANSEDDLVHGGYRDRVVVELAQNAADAADAAGIPGRLLLRLEPDPAGGTRLLAANTGAALDAAGVQGLATLRASAKRDAAGSTGRFGVGFAAVLSVSDAPCLFSLEGGVCFSRARTLAAVRAVAADHPGLAAELDRRRDRVPALRLPFTLEADEPATDARPPGYDTVVVLPLRDEAADAQVGRLLDDVDDALLLALPALSEVTIERPDAPPRTITDVAGRWTVHTRGGRHLAADLADLPVEERERTDFSVTWAVPSGQDDAESWAHVLHAPTATAEPLPWPVLLIAHVPVEPDRRAVRPGPAADAVVALAAEAFAELAESLADPTAGSTGAETDPLDLLPDPASLPAGRFDASLRDAVLERLASARVLPRATPGPESDVGAQARLARPCEAVVLEGPGAGDPAVLAAIGARLPDLVSVPRRHAATLRRLGVRRAELAELVERWPGPADPDDALAWRGWFTALAPAASDPAVREQLAALAVPVLGGPDGGIRVVRGARGTVMLEIDPDSIGPDAVTRESGVDLVDRALVTLSARGLRILAPEVTAEPAVADLLARLGAQAAEPAVVLEHPMVRAAVLAGPDDEDPDELAEAVLTLVRLSLAAGHDPARLSWLADLALPDADGDLVGAGLLVQAGSPMAAILDEEGAGLLHERVARRWPVEVLQAVGVAARPVVVRAESVETDDLPPELDELDGAAQWARELAEGASQDAARPFAPAAEVAGEVLAVRDLDLVHPDRLKELVALLLAEPLARRALVEPVTVRLDADRPGGPRPTRRRPSYTAWWLRGEIGSATTGPDTTATLRGLLPAAPGWVADLDREAAAALGVVTEWGDLDDAGRRAVLRGLEEPDTVTLLRLWAGLVAADPSPGTLAESGPVLALDGQGRTVRSDDPVVADDPAWLHLLRRSGAAAFLVAPAGRADVLADAMDLDLASQRLPGRLTSEGTSAPVPDAVRLAWPAAPARWVEHEDLLVDRAALDWWVARDDPGDGIEQPVTVHAATLDGLACALALAGDVWSERHTIAAVLTGLDGALDLLLEDACG